MVLTSFDEAAVRQREIARDELDSLELGPGKTHWLEVRGVHDPQLIAAVGERFGLHPLVLEDILDTGHRPKIEEHDEMLFLLLKRVNFTADTHELSLEQISLVLVGNVLISFKETEEDLFAPLRQRIEHSAGRVRKQGADYLMYCLVDMLVDGYFLTLEAMGEVLDGVEESIESDPRTETIRAIHRLRRQAIGVRRSVWPLREILSALHRREHPLLGEDTQPYLRDLYDHVVQVVDSSETQRDVLAGLMDLYLSSVSNRMNAVMKVLTIIATIFIPLTFIAGIYGMNFKYMPELDLPWGYPVVLGIMGVVTLGMIFFFRRKGWI
jgi:magnesium transporter